MVDETLMFQSMLQKTNVVCKECDIVTTYLVAIYIYSYPAKVLKVKKKNHLIHKQKSSKVLPKPPNINLQQLLGWFSW